MHPSRPSDRPWRRRLRLAGTALSLALLGWLLARQDWAALREHASALSAFTLAQAFGVMLVGQVFNAARWYMLLRAQALGLGFLRAVQLVFVGLFASNFLPTTIGGDVLRVAGVAFPSQRRLEAAASVVMDRAVSVFGMLFVLPFSWPLVRGFLEVGVLGQAALAEPWGERVRSLGRRLRQTLLPWVRRPGALAAALLASWAGVLCYFLAVWSVAVGLRIPVGLADVAGATALTYFLTMLPVTINGYGLRELGVLALYTQLGATPEQATALALVTRALQVAVSLPGALWVGALLREAALAAQEEVV